MYLPQNCDSKITDWWDPRKMPKDEDEMLHVQIKNCSKSKSENKKNKQKSKFLEVEDTVLV